MYDATKILTGLIIGIGLFMSPFFYNAGKAAKAPTPELTPKAKEAKVCVESKEYMRAKHMQLLDTWRHTVVRDEVRYFRSPVDDKMYYMSLQQTCMDCHSNKSKFCDSCHNYMGIKPYCWECHVEPKEPKEKG